MNTATVTPLKTSQTIKTFMQAESDLHAEIVAWLRPHCAEYALAAQTLGIRYIEHTLKRLKRIQENDLVGAEAAEVEVKQIWIRLAGLITAAIQVCGADYTELAPAFKERDDRIRTPTTH